MTTQNTWTFDDGPIRSITAEPGRIVVAKEDAQLTITRKGEGHLLGFAMMSQGLREQVGALLGAYAIAWPDPVPSPGSITVTPNFTIGEVKP
jgi:hypothetical protein